MSFDYEVTNEGLSALLETYQFKIHDLESDVESLEEDLRQAQDDLEVAHSDNYDLQQDFDKYRAKLETYVDTLVEVAKLIED